MTNNQFSKLALLLNILLRFLVVAAQPSFPEYQPSSVGHKKADLGPLINETLTINNKTVAGSQQVLKDDWTFDMVEYDLIEFLQDLSARYSNRSYDQQESALDAKHSPNINQTSPHLLPSDTVSQSDTTNKPRILQNFTQSSQIPTSLASDDHNIAESNWQYGIFDRFTRPKSTTTTLEPLSLVESNERPETRIFNSDECGLRTYLEEVQYYPPREDDSEATKELIQRRQRVPVGPMAHKEYQLESMTDRRELSVDKKQWSASEEAKELLSSNSKQSNVPSSSDDNQAGSLDGGFNLSSRRQWLQQQLESTLQMLGFNSSIQSAAEFLNQTSGLSLNTRENMMKQAVKLARAAILDSDTTTSKLEDLAARQDELKLEARVIGGTDARLGDSPWSVSLQALVSRPGTGAVEYRHYCGGTIISEYYVLTAAHCLDFMVGRESRLFVVTGDLNWRMNTASLHGRRFGIDKLIIHSGYKNTAFGHDIGLIRTKEGMKPLKVRGKYIVNSVCLPERGVEHSGEAELVGWGLFSNRNEMADTLQIADVPILPRPLCVDLYRRRTGLIQWLIGIELITDKQVCAGTFGRGICQGDSGSALVYNERRRANMANRLSRSRLNEPDQTRAVIIGTVAFGGIRRCSYQSLPGVYMQTSKYLDWIIPRVKA